MSGKRLFSLILILTFWADLAFSQKSEIKKEQFIKNIIENISDNTDQDCDFSEFEDDLNYFWDNPIDLNSCTVEELKKLKLLNDFQVINLINYLSDYGKMVSLYELQLINGFSPGFIQEILPFITISPVDVKLAYTPGKAIKYGKHELLLCEEQVIEKQAGFSSVPDSEYAKNPNLRYLGSPQKIYFRYSFNYKNVLCWGLTAEKDAGEEFFKGSNRDGFDFYSAFLFVQNLKPFTRIVIGDYHVAFGQGLIMCSDWSSGKSTYVLNIGKTGQGLTKYSSSDENLFFRGAGTTVNLGKFEITEFISQKKIDGNLKKEINNYGVAGSDYEITSFETTGLHTIPSEIEDKHAVRETVKGANITYNQNCYKAGFSLINYEYDKYINPAFTLYNKYDFRGKQNSDASVDYSIVYKSTRLFGEDAMSLNKGRAFLNGIVISPVSAISFTILHRFYSPDFQAGYGKSFSISGNSNEKGIFAAVQILPYRHWNIIAYYDMYSFPWLKYLVSSPSEGSDNMIQVTFTPSERVKMNLKYRHQLKETDVNIYPDPLPVLGKVEITHLSYDISSEISEELLLDNRVEYLLYSSFGKSTERGFLMYQDVKYDPAGFPISFSLRYGIFDTGSYNSSVYAYEPDILFSSTPGFYSKGTRFYLLLKYKITKWVDIRLRYSQTYYIDRQSIGSGLSMINGNTKSEIKVLLKFTF